MSVKVTPYYKVKDGGVFASDIDDTLVMWYIPSDYKGPLLKITTNGYTEECIVNRPAVEHLKKMKRRAFSVIVWSAGGSDWAEAVVRALRIEEYVDIIMPKIDHHLDDILDPKDKIGKWQYINMQGDVFSLDNHGRVQKRKKNELIGDTE